MQAPARDKRNAAEVGGSSAGGSIQKPLAENLPPQIAVVYLAYLPYGLEPYEQFMASYREHPAGVDHTLLVALKGEGAEPSGVQTLRVPDDCLDLGTYIWIARNFKAKRYLFMNTSCEILVDGWLEKLNSHLGEKVGIVGATGSYGSPPINAPLKAPNPHLRTNAFMLERDLMLDLDWQEPIKTKHQAYAVEHGPKSLTTQITGRGLEAVLVGRDGDGFPVRQWAESRTFWVGDQENLMISDKATRRYMNHPRSRFKLSRFAWPPW